MPVSAVRATYLDGETNVGVVDFSDITYSDIYNEGGIATLPDTPFGEIPNTNGGTDDYWNQPSGTVAALLAQFNSLVTQLGSIITNIINNMGGGGMTIITGMAALLGVGLTWISQPNAILQTYTMPVLAGKIKTAILATLVNNPANKIMMELLSATDISKLVNVLFGAAVIVMGLGEKVRATPTSGVRIYTDTKDVNVLLTRVLSLLQGSGIVTTGGGGGDGGGGGGTIITYGTIVTDPHNISYKQLEYNYWIQINLSTGTRIGTSTYTTAYVFYQTYYQNTREIAVKALELVSSLISSKSALITYAWNVTTPNSPITELPLNATIPPTTIIRAGIIKVNPSAFDNIVVNIPAGFPPQSASQKLDIITLALVGPIIPIADMFAYWWLLLGVSVQNVISQTFSAHQVDAFITIDTHPTYLTQLANTRSAETYWTNLYANYYYGVLDNVLSLMCDELGGKTVNSSVGTFSCSTSYIYQNMPDGVTLGTSDTLTPFPTGTRYVILNLSISVIYLEKLMYKLSTNSGLPAMSKNFLLALSIIASFANKLDILQTRFSRDPTSNLDSAANKLIPGTICQYNHSSYLDTTTLVAASIRIKFITN